MLFKKKIFKYICYLGSVFFVIAVVKTCIDNTMHGFSYLNFQVTPPPDYSLQQAPISGIDKILSQTFTYFNYGGESIVFESSDQQWILKTFKKHRLSCYNQLKKIPFLKAGLEKREATVNQFWLSLKLQSEIIPDLCRLHYVHIPTCKAESKIHLVDPIGSHHFYDLNDTYYVIQQKGTLFKDVYFNNISEESRKQMLLKTVNFYKKLDKLNLKIWDNAISRNLGWIDDEPFIIDVGSVTPKDKNETFGNAIKYFRYWISEYDPDRYEFLLMLITTE